jgi:hypothetical protein
LEMKIHGCEAAHFHLLVLRLRTSGVIPPLCYTCNVVSLGSRPNCVSVKINDDYQ